MANFGIFFFISLASFAFARIPNWRVYPAGVNPLSCPDYPFCTGTETQRELMPAQEPVYDIIRYSDNRLAAVLCDNFPYCTTRYVPVSPSYQYQYPGYPANVSPQQCPNYPYCQ